jgi:hypothetical protein
VLILPLGSENKRQRISPRSSSPTRSAGRVGRAESIIEIKARLLALEEEKITLERSLHALEEEE